jgi:hypothetical protein
MKYENKLKKIGDHYKIPDFEKMSLTDKANACKKVTGKDTVSLAYDYMVADGKAVDGKKSGEVVEGKAVEVKSGSGSSTQVPPTSVAPTNLNHRVDVAAPNLIFNVSPPQVQVNHNGLTWGYFARQALLWTNGVMVGSLATAVVFMARALWS